MGAPKTASAGERPVSSLGCALSLRSTKGNSSDQVVAAARVRSVLEAAVKSFDRIVRLRVISSCLPVGDVEHLAQFKPEVGSELQATIRSDRFRDTKTGNPSKSQSLRA